MRTKERYAQIIKWFIENKPVAETELDYKNPFQLLVAVILSAQCTDKRVNIVTPPLFDAYPDAEHMALANEDEIFNYIRSVTFPNNKSKALVAMARMLVEDYGGDVPDTMESLVKIPGVGRKTANVILSVIFNKAAMAVDTHVFRVSNRIGLTDNSPNPLVTERILMKHIPAEYVPIAHHWLILHGRYVCKARKPECMECGIKDYCKYYNQLKG
ncbi:MAG: endonuclease III [Bacteroidales bacterium]